MEPELANDAQQSFRKGEIVELPAERVSSTLADGLRTQSIGPINFEHIRSYVDDMITVTEDEIRSAMRRMATECSHHRRAQRSRDLRGVALPRQGAAGVAKSRRGGQRRQRRSATAGAGAERGVDGIE